ncbi:GGDEF domain-containing protein [Bradyrhizobium sp. HKCCYLS20291]|uniref:GGDEF domain-containing protein n=2 Tax=Bradyrhizobium TaxID=374 RepID=UPI003EB85BD2
MKGRMIPQASVASAEHDEFKRMFSLLVALVTAAFTALFDLSAVFGLFWLSPVIFTANLVSMSVSIATATLLHVRPQWSKALAWVAAGNAYLLFLIALYTMPGDELRYVWFFTHAGSTFLLLGSRAGWATLAVTATIVVASRIAGLVVLSDNALPTFCFGLVAIGALYQCYNVRTAAFLRRIELGRNQLEYAASHDGLTGLLNRPAFMDRGCEVLSAAESAMQPVSLLFIDVDRFKTINDRHGHKGGDDTLVAVASAIASAVRADDVVARIGGEEIVVLLPDTDAADAFAMAEHLRGTVEAARPVVAGHVLSVTASIGWATNGPSAYSIEALLAEADEAMYRAKQSGRNRVEPRLAAGLVELVRRSRGLSDAPGLQPADDEVRDHRTAVSS